MNDIEFSKWHVSGTPTICDCKRAGFIITDHRGWLYGCRPTHEEAMAFAQQKATKAYRRELERA